MIHPHKYSLDLLKLLVEKAPFTFSGERKDEMLQKIQEMGKDPLLTLDEIETTMIAWGKEIWPYRKAYEEISRTVQEKQERTFFLNALPPKLREKYLGLKEEGLGIREFRSGGRMETIFSPEEKWEIDQAVLTARRQSERMADELVSGMMSAEYNQKLASFQKVLKQTDDKIGKLKDLNIKLPRLKDEILEKVHMIESGFSLLEPETSEQEIDKIIEYYQGMAEGGIR